MRVTQFPHCCGVGNIAHFPLEVSMLWVDNLERKKRIEEGIAETTKYLKALLSRTDYSMLIIILTNMQTKYLYKVLNKFKFHVKKKKINIHTGNMMYIYIWVKPC